MKALLPVSLLLLVLISCGFTPQMEERTAIQKERLYSFGFDLVWKSVISIFAELNIPVDNLEKDSGYISCRDARVPREWLYAPKDKVDYRLSDISGSFNVFVSEVEDGCKVSVNAIFNALVYRYNLLFGGRERREDFPSSGKMEEDFHLHLSSLLGE